MRLVTPQADREQEGVRLAVFDARTYFRAHRLTAGDLPCTTVGEVAGPAEPAPEATELVITGEDPLEVCFKDLAAIWRLGGLSE